MKIIGLDLSLTHTGFVLLNNGRVIAYATIIPKKLRGVQRLYFVKTEIKKVLTRYKPQLAVVEGYAYSPNANMAFSIGELGGIIKQLLYVNGVNYFMVAPKTLKKFTTGNGNANKEMMKLAVIKDWKVELNTEHEYDAFGLATMGHYAVNNIKRKQKQIEAVNTVIEDKSKQNYIKNKEGL